MSTSRARPSRTARNSTLPRPSTGPTRSGSTALTSAPRTGCEVGAGAGGPPSPHPGAQPGDSFVELAHAAVIAESAIRMMDGGRQPEAGANAGGVRWAPGWQPGRIERANAENPTTNAHTRSV